MKKGKAVFYLVLFLLIVFRALPQNAAAQSAAAQNNKDSGSGSPFYLLPILETVFSGDLLWRPNWPQDLPVDAFSVSNNYTSIELSNDDIIFSVKRDNKGRLAEFPFFSADSNAIVKPVFSADGALLKMTVAIQSNPSDSKNGSSKEEAKTVNIEFPQNFLPFSDLAPGGSFPPLIVASDEQTYYLFIFETPSFLTETWYDSEGNMLCFCKAIVNRNFKNGWKISSLQIYEKEDINFVDYYFESGANISEISFISGDEEKTFSALYRDKKPIFWKMEDFQNEMQWDTKGFLTIAKETTADGEAGAEYRYDYENDSIGNWVKRQETALGGSNLLVPQPSLSRGVWSRKIVYGEASGR